MEIELTEKQQEFMDAVMDGKSVILEGKSGSGKTTVTKMVIEALEKAGKDVVVLAPTGVAATNVGGQTIHSLFALPIGTVIDFEKCSFLRDNKRKVLRQIDVLLIDEISMCRADVIDGIHWTLKKNRIKGLNEMQVVMVGDMKQIPPIAKNGEEEELIEKFGGKYFYYSNVFKKLIRFKRIILDVVKRQSDEEFIEALNIIRDGGKSAYFKRFHGTETKGVVLAPHRDTVRFYNERGLSELDGEEHTFIADLWGKAKISDFNFDEEVTVKEGAKIMYLVNNKDTGLYNGITGIFRVIEGDFFIEIGDDMHRLLRVKKEKIEYVLENGKVRKEVIGHITQMPIRLAYAMTIHRAQGLTIKELTVDLSRPIFDKGMLYVALSRATSPEGLSIVTGKRKIKR